MGIKKAENQELQVVILLKQKKRKSEKLRFAIAKKRIVIIFQIY